MMLLATRVEQTARSGIMRAIESFRSNRFYLCLLLPVLALGLVRVLTAKPSAPSAKAAIEYFQQRAANRGIRRVEVYYMEWGALMLPVTEHDLRDSTWIYKSVVEFPNVPPFAGEFVKMGEEFGTMKLEPVKVPVEDFRLACVVTFNEDEKPFVLSFSKYPLAICVNGEAFEPSWKLLLGVSQFLPSVARPEVLAHIRADWARQGYPKIPDNEEVGEPNQPVKK
jgi:hypothetical protein